MKLNGLNKPLNEQLKIFKKIIMKDKELKKILEVLENSGLKNYYLAAGTINKAIINYYTNHDFNYGKSDIDIAYFDNDLSYKKEDKTIKKLEKLLFKFNRELDIKNQARAHLWYKSKFGYDINPFNSVEDAIKSWGFTIQCIGVRLENKKLIVYAPYGLDDLFSLTLRPVKTGVFTEEAYNKKVLKWTSVWKELKVIKWND